MRLIALSITTVLLSGGLLGVTSAPFALADEPLPQSTPSTGTGGTLDSTTGEQAPVSPATAPTMKEEPAQPTEGSVVQERGIFPGVVAPGVNRFPVPAVPAPTPILTAIRNSIRVTSKGISVNLRIPPNLPVTVPVEVSVYYNSPFQSQILKRTYSPTSGLTLLYRDAEGNGEPRKMNVEITVRELIPNGQVTAMHKEFTVTPLYDVFVTDLRFVMASKCDLVGKSDITFRWVSPDGQFNEQKFKLGEGEAKGITRFSWTRKEIAARDNLKEPRMNFFERDPNVGLDYHTPVVGPYIPMVPGPTTKYDFFLKNEATGPPGLQGAIGSNACVARVTYTIIKALMPFDKF